MANTVQICKMYNCEKKLHEDNKKCIENLLNQDMICSLFSNRNMLICLQYICQLSLKVVPIYFLKGLKNLWNDILKGKEEGGTGFFRGAALPAQGKTQSLPTLQ